MLSHYKNPHTFYALSFLIPWGCWYSAGYFSHLQVSDYNYDYLVALLSFIGLCAPIIIALALTKNNQELRRDILKRMVSIKGIKFKYWLFAFGFMLLSILIAQLVSLVFGYSIKQFLLAESFSFSSAVFPVWLLLIFAPLIEELGWHSYGTDCLRNKFNLLNTSLIFAFFWGIWHIPLSSINNYYHSNITEIHWIHSLNFLLSIFPFVIIMNWLYYKTNRSILITIVFHISANYFNEIFATHPDTKVIQTALLTIFSIALVMSDKEYFLSKAYK